MRIESIEGAVGFQEPLLRGVGRAVGSGDGRSKPDRGALMPAHEFGVRIVISGLGLPDPTCVVQNTSRVVNVLAPVPAQVSSGSALWSIAQGDVAHALRGHTSFRMRLTPGTV